MEQRLISPHVLLPDQIPEYCILVRMYHPWSLQPMPTKTGNKCQMRQIGPKTTTSQCGQLLPKTPRNKGSKHRGVSSAPRYEHVRYHWRNPLFEACFESVSYHSEQSFYYVAGLKFCKVEDICVFQYDAEQQYMSFNIHSVSTMGHWSEILIMTYIGALFILNLRT